MRLPAVVERAVTRWEPPAATRAGGVLRAASSFLTSGPRIGTPSLSRALVLAPHPDDESLGCGGTTALLAQGGASVRVLCVTDGTGTPGTGLARAEVGRRRKGEASSACRILGLPEPFFLGLPDGKVDARVPELAAIVAEHVADTRASAVFAPWPGDGHRDHVAVAMAVAVAALPDNVMVWGYETWGPLIPNRIVDITIVSPQKQAAVASHVTAHASFDVSAMMALSRYRSVHGLRGVGEAEAFLALPHPEHRRLCAFLSGPSAEGHPDGWLARAANAQ